MAGFLSRDAILGAVDTEYQTVDVPEWGGQVRVRSISAAERERLMKLSVVTEGRGAKQTQRFDMPTFRVKLAALSMVDDDGRRLFTDDDMAALGRKSARALERVSDVALDLAGVQDDTKDDEGPKADS